MRTAHVKPRVEPKQARTVLIVENDKAVRTFLSYAIEGGGLNVLTCSTGGEAISMIREHQAEVALLLSDVNMPEMDGLTLARLAREIIPDLPVLFLSGSPLPRGSGPNWRFLPKPLDAKTLMNAVTELANFQAPDPPAFRKNGASGE